MKHDKRPMRHRWRKKGGRVVCERRHCGVEKTAHTVAKGCQSKATIKRRGKQS